MANTRSGNTWYVDSTTTTGTDLASKNIQVKYLLVSAGSTATGGGQLVLADASSNSPTKLNISLSTAKTSQEFRMWDAPLVFANGIRVASCGTGISATLVTQESTT